MLRKSSSLLIIGLAAAAFAGASRPSYAQHNVMANGYCYPNGVKTQVYVSGSNYSSPSGSIYIGLGANWAAGNINSIQFGANGATVQGFVMLSGGGFGTVSIVLGNAPYSVSYTITRYGAAAPSSATGTLPFSGYVCLW